MWLAEETKKNLPLELDFVNEARNCEKVAKMLDNFDFLKVSNICSFKSLFSIILLVLL